MSIRVNPDGSFDVETVEQALELSGRLKNTVAPAAAGGGSNGNAPAKHANGTNGATDAAVPWKEFMSLVRDKEQQMVALSAIKKTGVLTLSELRIELGLSNNNSVGGVMAGITKNAARAGVAHSKILRTKRDASGTMTYKAGSLLRALEVK